MGAFVRVTSITSSDFVPVTGADREVVKPAIARKAAARRGNEVGRMIMNGANGRD